jgi:hypothetical protein
MIRDKVCLVFDPKSSSCAQNFGFFSAGGWNRAVSIYWYSYLGLAPIDELNGPSFVQTLNETGVMANASVSW